MIALHSVSKRYRGRREQVVLCDVELHVDPGEVVLISGIAGSGKSTLLDLLHGALLADSGSVTVFGRDLARLRRASLALLRRHIGVIPQELLLLGDRSALANVALALEVCAEPRRSMRTRAAEALGAVGLACEVDTPVDELSGAQKQLVALARALVRDPAIVIADEPSLHLDNAGRDALVQALTASRDRGNAAVVASNDHKLLSAGAKLGWRHMELHDGTLWIIAERTADWAPRSELQAEGRSEAQSGIDIGAENPDSDGAQDGYGEVATVSNVVPFPLAANAGGLLE